MFNSQKIVDGGVCKKTAIAVFLCLKSYEPQGTLLGRYPDSLEHKLH
jgi:hypothetical protein